MEYKLWVFEGNENQVLEEDGVPVFKEFSLNELRKATNGFSTDYIVSESGEKAPNVVYRGKLHNNHLVAVKRFSKQSWPDAQQFVVGQCIIIVSIFVGLVAEKKRKTPFWRKKKKKEKRKEKKAFLLFCLVWLFEKV